MSLITRRLFISTLRVCSGRLTNSKEKFLTKNLIHNHNVHIRSISLVNSKCSLISNEICSNVQYDEERITITGNAPEAIKSFDDIQWPPFVRKVLDRKGFSQPTTIQANAIPAVLSNKDFVGIAKTGCGKTLAYLLPSFIAIKNFSERRPARSPLALVLAPTRELVQQIETVARDFDESVRSLSMFGGASKERQERQLMIKNPELLIATPGRLIDFLRSDVVKLSHVKYLVLDEADRMLDMGFEPQIREIIPYLPKERQTLMFSATWPNEVRELAEDFVNNYVQITVGSTELHANPNITQNVEVCTENDKRIKLLNLVDKLMKEPNQKILVFAQTKRTVDFLANMLQKKGFNADGIHGDRTQRQRDTMLDDFRNNRSQILVATDVAARGLDVNDIKYVINYDFPQCSEDYVHRIGRTGRMSKKGTSYTFFTEEDGARASELIQILKKANQDVHPTLVEISNTTQMFKKSKYRKRGEQMHQTKWKQANHMRSYNRFDSRRNSEFQDRNTRYSRSYQQRQEY